MFKIGYVGSVGIETQMSQSSISSFVSPFPSLQNKIAVLLLVLMFFPRFSGLTGILERL